MHSIGTLKDISFTPKRELVLSFQIEDKDKALNAIEELYEQRLSIDAEIYRDKRSLDANKYLWKLCSLIAEKIGSTKDTVYLMAIKDAGQYQDIDVVADAAEQIKRFFRYVDEQYRYFAEVGGQEKEMVSLRCYEGSHTYDTKQMHTLLESVISEANSLGISTITDEEFDRIIGSWRARKEVI